MNDIPAPGPAARVQRTAGQLGAVSVLLQLWFAFGWFGADTWSPEQAAAVTAVAGLLAALVQNVAGHLKAKQQRQQEVAPIEAAPPSAAAVEADEAKPLARRR